MINQTLQTAYNNIDDAAERARIRFYTSRLNQVLIYMEKTNEAIEFLAENNPTVEEYPFITAEHRATEEDPKQIAETILARRAEWLHLCTIIEEIRLNGKHHIRKLGNEQEIRKSCEWTVSTLDRLQPDRLKSQYGRRH